MWMTGKLARMQPGYFPVLDMTSYKIDVDVIFREIVKMKGAAVSVVAWILGTLECESLVVYF